ncbi:MAG: GNAT family N-acetyltransferase [Victivallales bacterium]|nr:GNAT family N-acetyltransferase [Victivallales bacterium]
MDFSSFFTDYVEMMPTGCVQAALGQLGGTSVLLFQRINEVPAEGWAHVRWLLRLAERSQSPLLLCGFNAETDGFLKELLTLQVPVFSIGGNLPVSDEAFAEGEGLLAYIGEKLSFFLDMNLEAMLARRRRRFEAFGQQPLAGIIQAEIRMATPEDVPHIHKFFQPFVDRQQILPRSEEEIRQNLEHFLLAVSVKDGALMGTVALRDFGGGLFEIRSLTVAKECERQGLGTRLVKASVELARQQGAKRIFTLTMRQGLFQRCGFNQVCIMRFPGKVQVDCLNCPKKEHCDEVALLLEV